MRTALAFRAHSGWAAMVAAASTIETPQVLDRRRITLAAPPLPSQPYHAAADLPILKAQAHVQKAIESARTLAQEAIASAVKSLRSQGHEVAACAVLLGSAKPLPGLESILASHALIHTAEGVMFRDALAWAAESLGLPVKGICEKELAPASLKRLDSLGKQLGPPWTQDQKYATLAALIALAATSS
jgi:hypothetical protein